jgi:hypothetical protein
VAFPNAIKVTWLNSVELFLVHIREEWRLIFTRVVQSWSELFLHKTHTYQNHQTIILFPKCCPSTLTHFCHRRGKALSCRQHRNK